ncbi:hypothetical protein Q1695_013736 [Nippostrongylus brasiliensis]|nr:hypothetical protein Q1695_013736 [Nippostrongylus brasiliensis]
MVDCHSENGLVCKCSISDHHRIELSNCSSPAQWSSWSKWSVCARNSREKRRRRCENAFTKSTSCTGPSMEQRNCTDRTTQLGKSQKPSRSFLPEFIWGLWSEWNEWGICSCPANVRQRNRYCIGHECSGCHIEYGKCERLCITERWWSDWSEWVQGQYNTRFRSWCSVGYDGRTLSTVLLNETRAIAQNSGEWSDWKIRPGVAFRYRLPVNSESNAVDIQYQLLAASPSTRVALSFSLYVGIIAVIAGFLAQCAISKLFSICRSTSTSHFRHSAYPDRY